MKKLLLLFVLMFYAGNLLAKDKFYATFEFNGKKYNCELIYQRSEIIPTYLLNIISMDKSTKTKKSTNLIIKRQDYTHNAQTNVEIWERFQKRRSSKRDSKEITFHIVDENNSYATFGFGNGILKEFYFNKELCLVKDRDSKIFIYKNESIIFAVVRQFLKSVNCLPNETTLTKIDK